MESHQTQGGKFGVNPALSRNCDETWNLASESECPPIVTLNTHLRGTDDTSEFSICKLQVSVPIQALLPIKYCFDLLRIILISYLVSW